MGLFALLRPLALMWTGLAAAALVTMFAAFALGEGESAAAFLFTAAGAGFLGGAFWTASSKAPIRARAVEALGLALLAYLLCPPLAALPFLLDGRAGGLDAWFEAVSALTTTGAVLAPPETEPRVFVFWRCLLSWLGGYAALMLAAAVFAALDRDAPAIRRSALLTIQPENVFSHLRLAARRVAAVYGVITGLIWLGLILSGLTLFEAACLSLSAVSTGGYVTQSGGLLETMGGPASLVIMIGAFAGAVSVAMYWDAIRDRFALLDPDIAGMAALVLGLTVLALLIAPQTGIFAATADSVFAVSTAGFSMTGEALPLPAATLFVALIGGAAASTSGGVKVSRILLLWRRLGAELGQLADPSSVMRVQHRGRSAPDKALIAVWSYVLGYAAALGTGGVLLAASGLEFEAAFAAVAASLSNAGPLYQSAAEGQLWSGLSDQAKLAVIPMMVLGRLEVLAALSAVWALFERR